MFTGLIELVCPVKSTRPKAGGAVLEVDLGELAKQVKTGDSVAVNGACLTAASVAGDITVFDVSGETLSKTTIGSLRTGAMVNIELALKADGRFGGHIVQGHIDGVGEIRTIKREAGFAEFEFSVDAAVLDEMVIKGSVAVDGISLTVAEIGGSWFRAAVVPVTLEKTTLGLAKIGDKVNIETDIIGKIIRKQLEKALPADKSITVDKLRQMGFD